MITTAQTNFRFVLLLLEWYKITTVVSRATVLSKVDVAAVCSHCGNS